MIEAKTPQSGATENVGAEAGEAASAAAEDMKASARKMAHDVAAEASEQAEHARGTAADEVKSVASALRTAAEELRSGSLQERAFSQIASSLADASDAVRDKDLGEMVQSVKGFARRNPLVFLGSAALVGFAATRFASASSHRTGAAPAGSPARSQSGTGSGMYGAEASGNARPAGTYPGGGASAATHDQGGGQK